MSMAGCLRSKGFTCAPAAIVSLRGINALGFADMVDFVSSAASSKKAAG